MTDLNGMTLPTCEILVNSQKRKLYGKNKNKVYLHNGDNFQLKFFNPLQERIGVQLSMNGVKIDNDLMVLNPGQEITIERFIGTNRKLTFSAYDIDTTNMSESRIKEATKAIEKNGVLEVTFWNEKIAPPIIYTSPITIPQFIPIYNTTISSGGTFDFLNSTQSNFTISQTGDVTINGNLKVNGAIDINGQLTVGKSGTSGSSGACGTSGTSGIAGAGGKKRVKGQNDDWCLFSSVDYAPQELSRGITCGNVNGMGSIMATPMSKKIETGRIEKGAISNQHFTPIAFEVGLPFYKIKFKLLPFSLKPLKKNSMTQQLLKML